MKRIASLLCFAVVAALSGSSLYADVPSTTNVPFAFKVKNISLPAGNYVVKQSPYNTITFLVNRETGQSVQLLRGDKRSKPGHAHLVFKQKNGEYELARIN